MASRQSLAAECWREGGVSINPQTRRGHHSQHTSSLPSHCTVHNTTALVSQQGEDWGGRGWKLETAQIFSFRKLPCIGCRYYESLETVGIKLHSKFTESCGSGVAGARHRGHQSSDGAPGADSVSPLSDGRGAQCQWREAEVTSDPVTNERMPKLP